MLTSATEVVVGQEVAHVAGAEVRTGCVGAVVFAQVCSF